MSVSPSSPIGLVAGTHTVIVGVEDDPGGGIRVYVDHRMHDRYFVPFPEDAPEVEKAWAGGLGFLLVDVVHAYSDPVAATLPGHEPGYHHRNARPL